MTSRPVGRGRILAVLGLALALPGLAACQSKRDVTGSVYPEDYRDRHPIVLGDKPRILDVFIEGPDGLAPRQRGDVAEFLREYQRSGNSGLIAQVPVGRSTAPGTRRALDTIRSAVGGRLAVQSYHPADPAMGSPIRLSFRKLEARVGSKCGLWPQDLGVSDYEYSAGNRQYWNLGCAYQSNLASQVADPVDLVRPRQETPSDIGKRMYNIQQLRKGEDPTTKWFDQGAATSSQFIRQ